MKIKSSHDIQVSLDAVLSLYTFFLRLGLKQYDNLPVAHEILYRSGFMFCLHVSFILW